MNSKEWAKDIQIGDRIKCLGGRMADLMGLTEGKLYEVSDIVTADWMAYPIPKVYNDVNHETWIMLDMFEPHIYKKHPEPTEFFF